MKAKLVEVAVEIQLQLTPDEVQMRVKRRIAGKLPSATAA